MIADATPGAFAVILAMAAVTLMLRWSGYFIMGRVRLGPKLEAGFRTLPGAVAAALFAPIIVADGLTALAAIIVAVVMARLGRGDTLTISAALAAAILLRQAGL